MGELIIIPMWAGMLRELWAAHRSNGGDLLRGIFARCMHLQRAFFLV